jgi:hypothetical protein
MKCTVGPCRDRPRCFKKQRNGRCVPARELGDESQEAFPKALPSFLGSSIDAAIAEFAPQRQVVSYNFKRATIAFDARA